MTTHDTTWTEATIADLRRLWDEAHSTAEIGRRLHVSKNAVVGKAHRLHLPPRPSPIRRGQGTSPRPAPAPGVASEAATPVRPPKEALAPAAAAGIVPVASLPAPIMPRGQVPPHRCCWPLGEPGRPGFRFCSAVADPGKPYCAEHRRRAYAAAPRPRTDRHAS